MSWAQWLLALSGPIARRAALWLGAAVMVTAGIDVVIRQLIVSAQGAWSSMPSAILSLASLAHVPEALGWILGAQFLRVTIWVKSRSAQMVLRGPKL